MHAPWDMFAAIVVACLGSTGLWTFINTRLESKSAQRQMILGIGYNSLVRACEKYIKRGWIAVGEYEDLNKYLFHPYVAMGGNGTAKALMDKVSNLPHDKKE